MDLNKFGILHNRKFHLIFLEKSFKQSLHLMQKYLLFRNLFEGFNYFVIELSWVEVTSKLLQDYFHKESEHMASKLTFTQLLPILHYMRLYHSQYRYDLLREPFLKFLLLSTTINYNLEDIYLQVTWSLEKVKD